MAKRDKNKWVKDIVEAMGDFAKQEGRPFAFAIIPVSCMDDMFRAARGGDKEARSALIAFGNWSKCVDEGMANGVMPSCVSCSKELSPVSDTSDGIGGWAQILPVKEAGIALVVPICVDCIDLDRQELTTKVFDALEEDIGVRAMMVQ